MDTFTQEWSVILFFLAIGVLLFVGKFMKTTFPIFSKFVLPTALLGGFIGFIIAQIYFNFILPPDQYEAVVGNFVNIMAIIVYHALAIGFISLTLKQGESKNKRKVWSTGMIITSTYALQGFIGILLVLMFFSDKFVGAGMLLPLGFGQGPGLATQFGRIWGEMLGSVTNGIALGASYAFLGFVFGGTVGVAAINILSKRKGEKKPGHYEDSSIETTTIQIDTVKEVSVLDGLTIQVVIIAIIYALVWLTLYVLSILLAYLPSTIGPTIFGLLKGFNFIIGIFYALIYKSILKKIQAKGKEVRFLKNDYVLSNISSLAFNIMITGSILTITIDFLGEYWLLLLVIASIGGIATLFYVRFLTKRVYPQFKDEYFVGLFGMLTGVASTGIALLKGLDKNLETPVAEEMVLGSGTAIAMALPLFLILMLPSIFYEKPSEGLFNYVALFGCLAYVVVMFIILFVRSNKKNASK